MKEGATTLDQVTATERQLFFAAAHAHFQNGCPLVAIEVMRKLPNEPLLVCPSLRQGSTHRRQLVPEINSSSGTLKDAHLMSIDESWSVDKFTTNGSDSSGSVNANKASSVDRGEPISTKPTNTSSVMDWSTPTNHVRFEDDIELDLGLGDSDSNEEEGGKKGKVDATLTNGGEKVNGEHVEEAPFQAEKVEAEDGKKRRSKYIDVMAQQYKFIACLKVLMEELGNLATGFEVDGGQLRYQLYIWLEKEVEVLKVLCNYNANDEPAVVSEDHMPGVSMEEPDSNSFDPVRRLRAASTRSDSLSAGKASLHEAFRADKHDLQSKVQRMARRKAWLKCHQHLLRTLASYCILQGSGGGGLASVHMELLLLLQELQQERPTQQLLSPLPFPTTLPLVSASITCSRSVIADPIQFLHCHVQDLVQTVLEMPLPPDVNTDIGMVSLIRDLSIALSSCIYQSLCDSDTFDIAISDAQDVGIDGFINPEFSYPSSNLMAGMKRNRQKSAGNALEVVNTPPAKWPGVMSLKVLLAREKDEDVPNIHVLLTESLLSVYSSLLIFALSMYDTQMLYRLVANKLDSGTWAAFFGGGVKIKIDKEPLSIAALAKGSQDNFNKHRRNYNLKAMSGSGKSVQESKETYQDKFLPPEISMINYFMSKPFISPSENIMEYDSDDSFPSDDDDDYEEEDDTDDEESTTKRSMSLAAKRAAIREHTDPNSYSWSLIRYAVVKLCIENLNSFLPEIGMDSADLPNMSPSLHAVMRTLERWEEILVSKMDLFSCTPDNYIPSLLLDVTHGQPNSKLKALMLPENSPFISSQATLPIKRLWFFLVKQKHLREIFLRYVYKKKREPDDSDVGSMKTSSSDNEQQVRDPMKIIHKEQDIITSFAINQANNKQLVLATQKEIVELDISLLLRPPAWLDDDNEYDIEVLRIPTPGPEMPEFLVVQTPHDTPQPVSGSQTPSASYMPSPSYSQTSLQTGRGTSVPMPHAKTIQRRQVLGVRRIGSHPVLPRYLTGGADGAVKLWDWGHGHAVTTLRAPGSFPKVTKVLFNAQGNKCCVSDTEGSICLWQVGLGSNYNKPMMSLQCHNKTTSDFQFVGSSSLIATAGQSSEQKNVCLWDTLLPARSSLIHAFHCHEQGSPAVVYASRQHLLISGGRKGEICIFDLRQRVLKHTFQAHEAPIKCLTLDPDEDYFITGSAEGDIKVWGLKIHQLIFSFPGEHSKTTFFKNVGSTSGVAQLSVGPLNHLYSCGVDGSMKFRRLPERELVVHHWA